MASNQPNTLARIETLPEHVLQLIFEGGSEQREVDLKYSYAISQVSRKFRNIALTTPALWTKITLKLPHRKLDKYKRGAEPWRKVLARSSAHRLFVHVHFSSGPVSETARQAALDTLLPLFSRAKAFHLQSTSATIVHRLFYRPIQLPTAEHLQSLEIFGTCIPSLERLILIFSTGPTLRQIHLNQVILDSHDITPSFIAPVLSQLRTLWIEGSAFTTGDWSCYNLLQHTSLPRLTKLIVGTRTSTPAPFGPISTPLEAAPNNLHGIRVFALHGLITVTSSALLHTLIQLPSLRRLLMGCVRVQGPRAPLIGNTVNLAVPQLQEIVLKGCSGTTSTIRFLTNDTAPSSPYQGAIRRPENETHSSGPILDRTTIGKFLPLEMSRWARANLTSYEEQNVDHGAGKMNFEAWTRDWVREEIWDE